MADRVILLCIIALAGLYWWGTEQLPSLEIGDPLGPKAFPRLLVAGLVVTGIMLLFEIVRARKTVSAPVKAATAGDSRAYIVVVLVALWTLLYFLRSSRWATSSQRRSICSC
jgi:putative tricarboxylic transport membrane protein